MSFGCIGRMIILCFVGGSFSIQFLVFGINNWDLTTLSNFPTRRKLTSPGSKGYSSWTRATDGLKINLYGVDAFYVEAWYDPEFNCIVKFRAFRSVDALAPYLDLIELEFYPSY